MASPEDRSTAYSGFATEGNARVHAGHNIYNNNTVNNYNPTRSDETLPGPDRYKAFSQAVVEGQVPRIRNFLRTGVNLDEAGASGLTVLHRAVLSGHEDVVDILIEAGADVNAMSDDFGTPLCLAALRGAHEVVALLLRRRARPSTVATRLGTALHCCVLGSQGRRATIDALLRADASTSTLATIDTRWLQAICEWDGSAQKPLRSPEEFDGCILHDATPAYIAIRTMQSDLLNYLLPTDLESQFEITFLKATDDTHNSSPHVRSVQRSRFDMTRPPPRHTYLSSSAMTYDLATVRLLIARRASLQSDAVGCDITALMIAAGQGSSEIVRLLLDSGALLDKCSRARWTALHYAAASGNDDTVRLLCERGASVDCRDFEGRTPLSVAPDYMSPSDNYRPLQTLLRAGADINSCDDEGLTPLHKILQRDQINTVVLEEFVKAGANTRLVTNDATSVLKLCMSMPAPGPALMAIGRGLNYGTAFVQTMCDRLNHVRDACEDPDDREHMLVYLSAQAEYEDVEFLFSLGCDVMVIDAYIGDEGSVPVATGATVNDEAGPVRTPSGDGGSSRAQGAESNVLSASRTVSPRDMTTVASANLTASSQGSDPTDLVGPSNINESRTSNSSNLVITDSLIADSLIAESLFAESLVAESMLAESLAAQSFFEESLATQSSTESESPQNPQRARVRQWSRTTSSVPREGTINPSDREARPSRTVGWARPARRDRQKRVSGGS